MAKRKNASIHKKELLVVAIVFAILGSVITGVSMAAKGGKTELTGTVSIAGPERQLYYGDSVSYDWSIDGKLAKNYTVSFLTGCRQHGENVYLWASSEGGTIPLRSQYNSQNPDGAWDSTQDAECTVLFRYQPKNKNNQVLELLDFTVLAEQ